MPEIHVTTSAKEFIKTYYYRSELVRFCRDNKLPHLGQKVELEAIIIDFLNGKEVREIPKIIRSKWVQDTLALDAEVTDNYKSNQVTREFFKSIIGPHFKFNVGMVNYKKFHPNQKIIYQDLVNEYHEHKRNQKLGITTSDKYYKGNRYNKFVKQFYANEINKSKSRSEMIKEWNKLKRSGSVNDL